MEGGTKLETGFLFASGLLLKGLVARARFKLLQILFLPASITGGLIGLVILQGGLAMDGTGPSWIPEQAKSIVDELHTWPGWLIAVVFAGLAALAIAPLYEKTHRQIAGALRMIGGVLALFGLFLLV